jgi:hypothetical protein
MTRNPCKVPTDVRKVTEHSIFLALDSFDLVSGEGR